MKARPFGNTVRSGASWLRMPALQLACLMLVLLALRVCSVSTLGTDEARFLGQGTLLAQTAAQACARSALTPKTAQFALAALSTPPGFIGAAVLTPGGHAMAHRGSSLGGWRLANSSPWTEIPASGRQPAHTLFYATVPIHSARTLIVVALDRSAFIEPFRRAQRLQVGFLLSLLVLIGLSLANTVCLHRDRCRLIREVRRVQQHPRANPPAPTLQTGDLAPLAQISHDMVVALHQSCTQLRQDEAQYRSLFENAVHGIWQTTPEGRYLCLNPAMAAIYGFPSVEDLPKHLEGSPSPYVVPHRRAEIVRLMRETGSVTGFESQIRRGDGRLIWISETVRAVRDTAGKVCRWEGTVEDITARKRAEADRLHLGNHLRLLLEASGEGIYGIDAQGHCTFINPMGAQMLGYQPHEMLGRSMHALIHHSHPDRSQYPQERSYLYQSLQTGQRFRVDDEVLWRKDGTAFPTEYTTAPLIEHGRTAGAVVTFVDISVRKTVEAEQRRLLTEALERADHDPLTSLLNHRAFHKRLHEEADRAQRNGASLAVALLDIDNFKFFNDVYGHKVGDEVLCLVADALRVSSRSYDVLARFGGDEFAVLLPCSAEDTAVVLTRQLNERLSGVSYRLPDHDISIPLGISLGVALFPMDGPTRTEALELADERLRRAKTGGDEDGYAERVRSAALHTHEGFSMLDALVTAVDNKDRYTRRHSEDVMRYSAQIAQGLGLDQAQQRLVEVAGLIHDVGKIGVPDSILRKPGQLTEEEFAAVRQHPIMGAVIAESVPGFADTLEAIRHHHERWDGRGYPAGLAGEDIPFIARLMAVADSFSAMTTDRPYRKGMDRTKALAILQEGAGVQWDPQCVAAFLNAQSVTC